MRISSTPAFIFIPALIWLVLLLDNSLTIAEPVWRNEKWLLARFRQGDIDTIRSLLDSIPEMTQAQQLLKGIFEPDGEAARFYYDRVVALYPNSGVEATALERLWQYHWAKGDGKHARQYWDFLRRRHPDYPGLNDCPDFNSESDLEGLIDENHRVGFNSQTEITSGWTIQLGAFRNLEGARKTARKAVPYGDVRYLEKVSKGKTLTVVQVGLYSSHEEAEAVRKRIRAATGIKGRVVAFQNNQ